LTLGEIDLARYEELSRAIEESVRMACEGKEVAVAFSGGMDSGLVAALAKRYAKSVTCYTCGTKDSFDVRAGKDTASKLDLPFVHVQISKGVIEDLIKEMVTATGVSDPFTISYELQLFSVLKECKEDTVLTGQGADEYFMGCAKYVGQSKEEFELLKNAGVERLMNISVPCELEMASYFGKSLHYPYLTERVVEEVSKLDPESLVPKDMDSRKQVLKDVSVDFGYGFLAGKKKKSSQYGSGTTDLIRAIARERGIGYANLIATLYDEVVYGSVQKQRGAVVNARIDPIIKLRAEKILMDQGLSPSDAIEGFYRGIIEQAEKDSSQDQ
jgi:asparagine synthase (glutamine-hydrolysing)